MVYLVLEFSKEQQTFAKVEIMWTFSKTYWLLLMVQSIWAIRLHRWKAQRMKVLEAQKWTVLEHMLHIRLLPADMRTVYQQQEVKTLLTLNWIGLLHHAIKP